jgi:hypothetical protein
MLVARGWEEELMESFLFKQLQSLRICGEGSSKVWPQGLILAGQVLYPFSHASSPSFLSFIFWIVCFYMDQP